MPITVTENWSGQRLSLKPPWTATREFVVSEVSTNAEALAAVDSTTGLKIPQETDPLVAGSSMLCTGPEVKEWKGPLYCVVTAPYIYNPGDLFVPTGNPLTDPAKYRWEHVEVSEPVDIDLDNRPIQNAALSRLDGATRVVAYKRLHVTRNEPFFDVTKCIAFENTTNNAPVVLTYGVTLQKGQMRVVSIQPEIEYYGTATFLPIHYVLECIFDQSLGKYPFQHRFLNQGVEGWYSGTSGPTKARFSDGQGNLVTDPIALALNGTINAAVFPNAKVGPDNQASVAPPSAATYYDTDTTVVNGIALYFRKTLESNINALGL